MLFIPEEVNVTNPYQYAGFGIRFAAFLLDSLILCLIIIPLLIYAYGIDYFLPSSMIKQLLAVSQGGSIFRGYLDIFLQMILPAIAFIIFWIYRSATPGKMILHLVIIDAASGKPPSPKQCLIRYLSYYVSLLPFGLGFIWIEFNPKKQAWHDLIAHTYVIHRK